MLSKEQLQGISDLYKKGFETMKRDEILTKESACIMFNSTVVEMSKIISYYEIPLHPEYEFSDKFTIGILELLREVLRVNRERLIPTGIISLPDILYKEIGL